MNLAGMLVDAVTVARRREKGKDRYGAPSYEWVKDPSPVRGRLIYPSSREENTRRDAQVEAAFVVLDPRAAVDGRCRLHLAGHAQPFEVDGAPLPQRTRSGWVHHLRVKVRRVEG
ncbi:hypothetical protein ABT160_23500 [Streptomyces sp. NPDC001941]|uniref:hypothetical protein n=1 Tax=Streptomyces sp. NPDC001941 TaxID=3154659 RepID=UPI003330F140